MSMWSAIKNLFIPWNLIRRDKDADNDEAVRNVMFGQSLIDGMAGNVTDQTEPPSRQRAPNHPRADEAPLPK